MSERNELKPTHTLHTRANEGAGGGTKRGGGGAKRGGGGANIGPFGCVSRVDRCKRVHGQPYFVFILALTPSYHKSLAAPIAAAHLLTRSSLALRYSLIWFTKEGRGVKVEKTVALLEMPKK